LNLHTSYEAPEIVLFVQPEGGVVAVAVLKSSFNRTVCADTAPPSITKHNAAFNAVLNPQGE
jgi:hypothetical protein